MTMPKNYFIEVLKREINREVAGKLIGYIERSDFFTAIGRES